MHIFHKWGKWAVHEEGPIKAGYRWIPEEQWRRVGYWVTMIRICEKCNNIELKTINHEP